MNYRFLQNQPATLATEFAPAGTIVDPGAVTLEVVRDDGAVLVVDSTLAGGSGAAARTFTLTSAQTALLDTLKVTWSSPAYGDQIDTVEIVGKFLFTLAEARAQAPLE